MVASNEYDITRVNVAAGENTGNYNGQKEI